MDEEFLEYAMQEADDTVSLQEVRKALSKIPGSLAADVIASREERYVILTNKLNILVRSEAIHCRRAEHAMNCATTNGPIHPGRQTLILKITWMVYYSICFDVGSLPTWQTGYST